MTLVAWRWIAFALAGLLVAGGVATRFVGRVAPIPPIFDSSPTLDQARQGARARQTPDGGVLILATADWCRYCQDLKRGPLADERVSAAIRRAWTPVYLELSNRRSDPAEADLADRLGVGAVPVLILERQGREVSRLTGFHTTDTVLAWIESGGKALPTSDGRAGTLPRPR